MPGINLNKIINTAKAVIESEAEALKKLSTCLDSNFANVVLEISKLNGNRVILSGVGKSGHIARKIAATFSSTGTPSFYIHPTEASHGDLGMINDDDVVILISKSGESEELLDLINYCHRHSIIIVAITASKESSLAKTANYLLLLADCPESPPLGIAPTTSTIMSLSIGDALALSVLDVRNFQVSNFREFHPGGKLGRKLMRVKDIMHTGNNLPIINNTECIGNAVLEMTRTRFGCVGIVNAKNILIGIFTDGDLRRHFSATTLNKNIEQVMTKNPKEIAPDSIISDVAHLFSKQRIPSVFVTEEHQPIGIVHMHDLLEGGLV